MRSALDRGCGGIRRAFEPPGDGGLVDHRLAPVREMCRRCAPDLAQLPNKAGRMDRACELNVELQLRRIAATPILRGACSASRKDLMSVYHAGAVLLTGPVGDLWNRPKAGICLGSTALPARPPRAASGRPG